MRWNKILLTLAVSALAVSAQAEPWTVLKGHSSAITEAREAVVTTPEQWKKLWKEHAARTKAPLPEADFDKETVIAVFAGQRMKGGCDIQAEVLRKKGSPSVTVLYSVLEPKAAGLTVMMLTQPYLFMKIPKPAGPLSVMSKARSKLEKNALRSEPGIREFGKRLEGLAAASGTDVFDGF